MDVEFVVVLQAALDGVLLLSPLTNFMVAEHSIDPASSELRFGLQGMLGTVRHCFSSTFFCLITAFLDFSLSLSLPLGPSWLLD